MEIEYGEPVPDGEIREPPAGLWGIIRHIGPGIVLSGSVIGSGELLVTTRMGAQFGFVFMWGVILCCLIKYFVQIEFGRHCMATNSTSIQAINRFPIFKVRNTTILNVFFFAIMVMITPGLSGIFGANAGLLYSVFPAVPAKVWGVILYAVVMIMLWRGFYKDIEIVVVALVGGFSIAVLLCFFLMQGTEQYHVSWSQFTSGLTFKIPEGSMLVAIALMGSTGVTAGEMFMYPYWIKEKGYARWVGPLTGSNREDWARRCKGWVNVIKADAIICTAIATIITIAYFLISSSILYAGLKVVPTGVEVAKGLASMFTESYGRWSYALFMGGAFCTLFSTVYVNAAFAGRVWTDICDSLKLVKLETDEDRLKWHRFFQMFWPGLWLIFFIGIPKPMTILIWGLRFNGLWLPFIALGILFIARHTLKDIKMNLGEQIALWATVVVMIAYTFMYFLFSVQEPLWYRWGFAIVLILFTIYTLVVTLRRRASA